MNKPKLLIALFRLPYPATDGTRFKIVHTVAEGLKTDYDIEFFVVNIKSFRQEDIEYLEKNHGPVHVFHHSKLEYGFNAIPALWNGLPLQAEAFNFRDAKKWLDAHIDDYESIYIHEIRMTELFIHYSDNQKRKFLVDFNDAISMNYLSGYGKASFLKKLFYRFEGNRVKKYESRVLNSFKHFTIVSEVDRSYLLKNANQQLSEVDFSVIPHGVPLGGPDALRDRDQLFFIGSLDYEPNRDALLYLSETLWPDMKKAIPSLELLIVGGGVIPEHLKEIPGIRFLGFVPNVFESIKHCKAMIAPIRTAGGTPSKILDAFAYGIPVITTPQAVAGITGSESGTNVITVPFDKREEWISILINLCSNSELRSRIAANARRLVEEHYSLIATQKMMRERFKKML